MELKIKQADISGLLKPCAITITIFIDIIVPFSDPV
jgi:hypothetical protein